MSDQPPFEFEQIHHVQLAIPAGSEELCRAFWRDVLGLTELTKPPLLAARGGCWFRGGALEVHLGVEEPFAPAGKAHPGLRVAGIDAIGAALSSAGYPVSWDDDFPGFRRFYSADPFGNRLEFLQAR
jgi:catechol 2,3-dioxygenase-like lactoylglutathione lyase family enzyme